MRYKFKDKEGFGPLFTYIHPYKQKDFPKSDNF